MDPVSVAVPGLESAEIVLAKDQPEYIPLPALPVNIEGSLGLLTRWRFTDEERAAIAAGADLWLTQLTFGKNFQPVSLSTECPIMPGMVQ